jgi:hypothetical protein
VDRQAEEHQWYVAQFYPSFFSEILCKFSGYVGSVAQMMIFGPLHHAG